MKQSEVIEKFLNFDYEEKDLPIKKGRVRIYNGRLSYVDKWGEESLVAFWHRGTLFRGTPGSYRDSQATQKFKELVSDSIRKAGIDDKFVYSDYFNSVRDIFKEEMTYEGVWPVELREKIVKKMLQDSLYFALSNLKHRVSSLMEGRNDLDKKIRGLSLSRFKFEESHFIIRTIADNFDLNEETLNHFKLMEKIDEKFSGLVNLVGAARVVQAAGAGAS